MKVLNLTSRLIIIFSVCMAIIVIVMIFFRAKKTNMKEYPAEMLLKTSMQYHIPKSASFTINSQYLIASGAVKQLKG